MDTRMDYLTNSNFSRQSYLNNADQNRRQSEQKLVNEERAQSMLQQNQKSYINE